ncbi:unnamed protein product [Bemisia tabaci]|uniref:Hedgehog N-terminal signalling domain-containing protein n=1 Tax=Bemisia tabaci TaxID=7038 RepID=A0A9P0AMV3_BEMTA|nr:unnamed protein product [Bemisia tabaci]
MLSSGISPIAAIPGAPSDPKSVILRFLVLMAMHVAVESCAVRTPRMSPKARLRPFLLYEHVPRKPETSFAASGPPLGRIHRDDHRFKHLVPIDNPDIHFKDPREREGYFVTKVMSSLR